MLDNLSEFVLDLISAHSTYGSMCIDALIKHYIIDNPDQADARPANPDLFLVIHETLAALMLLAPVQRPMVIAALRKFFPNKWQHCQCIGTYARNLIELLHHVPDMSADVLSICIAEMVKLDVEIKDFAEVGDPADSPGADLELEEESALDAVERPAETVSVCVFVSECVSVCVCVCVCLGGNVILSLFLSLSPFLHCSQAPCRCPRGRARSWTC
jgi:hypothetical protein